MQTLDLQPIADKLAAVLTLLLPLLTAFAGLLVYIVLWLIIPARPA